MSRVARWILKLLGRTPIVGGLWSCRGKDVSEAFFETLITTAVATVPIWLGIIVFIIFLKGGDGTFQRYLFANMKNGDLFLLSAATAGSLIYISTRQYGAVPKGLTRKFPSGRFFTFFGLFLCLIVGAAFAVLRLSQQYPTIIELNEFNIVGWSTVSYLLAIFFLFLAQAYRNLLEGGASDAFMDSDVTFSQEWEDNK